MRDIKEKKLWTIDQALEKNGGPIPMSRAGIYKACADGTIATVRIGRRLFIPSWFLNRLISE